MFFRSALLSGALFATSVAAYGVTITVDWTTATNSTYTGLYDDSGNQTSSTVNIEYVQSEETYDASIPAPYYVTYAPISGVWQTKVKFHFSSSGWQSVSGTTAIGVQLCHFVASNNAVAFPPQAYFKLPYSNPISYSSGWVASDDPSVVNYRIFYRNQLSVDTSDWTGKTGYATWSSTSTTSYPWDLFPYSVTVGGIDPHTDLTGIVWLFPSVNAGSGFHSPVGPAWPVYPVGAD